MSRPGADLIIAEYPDGLPVPGISQPVSSIPTWNATVQDFLKHTVGFLGGFLHDDGAFLLFYPDNPLIKKEIAAFFNKNNLKMMEEWTICNDLHSCHPLTPAKLVRYFDKFAQAELCLLVDGNESNLCMI